MEESDRYLLGMSWRGKYYVDLSLPFGLRSAPPIFNSVADWFHWILAHNWDVDDLLHYLDDHFTLGPAGSDVCAKRLEAIDAAAQYIGTPLSPEKCEPPSTCLTFLGIELDAIAMTAQLPRGETRWNNGSPDGMGREKVVQSNRIAISSA